MKKSAKKDKKWVDIMKKIQYSINVQKEQRICMGDAKELNPTSDG